VGMRVRRTFLNGIRSQGGFYLVNEICLRGRCDALAGARGQEGASHLSKQDSVPGWTPPVQRDSPTGKMRRTRAVDAQSTGRI